MLIKTKIILYIWPINQISLEKFFKGDKPQSEFHRLFAKSIEIDRNEICFVLETIEPFPNDIAYKVLTLGGHIGHIVASKNSIKDYFSII